MKNALKFVFGFSVGDHDRITIMINFLKLDHDRNRSGSKWIMIETDIFF
jgi:hypothetical protein